MEKIIGTTLKGKKEQTALESLCRRIAESDGKSIVARVRLGQWLRAKAGMKPADLLEEAGDFAHVLRNSKGEDSDRAIKSVRAYHVVLADAADFLSGHDWYRDWTNTNGEGLILRNPSVIKYIGQQSRKKPEDRTFDEDALLNACLALIEGNATADIFAILGKPQANKTGAKSWTERLHRLLDETQGDHTQALAETRIHGLTCGKLSGSDLAGFATTVISGLTRPELEIIADAVSARAAALDSAAKKSAAKKSALDAAAKKSAAKAAAA